MRAPTPLEVCKQIAAEHAAGTLAALEKERAAKLAAQLADYGQTLGELTRREPRARSDRRSLRANPGQPTSTRATPEPRRLNSAGPSGHRGPPSPGGSPPPTGPQPAIATALAEPVRAPRAPHHDVNDEKEGLTS